MSKEQWHKGYKEVKNVIHNDIGITKEEILKVFRQIAKDEVHKIVSDNRAFIYTTLKDVIKSEMAEAIHNHKYPKVSGSVWHYGYNGNGSEEFKSYVSGVMKEEIVKELREQFDISLDIAKKD